MKTLAFAIIVLSAAALVASEEFTKTPKASKEEEAAFLDIVRQIAETQKDIEAYYSDLVERGKVRKPTGQAAGAGSVFTELETQAEQETYYGQRDRYIYNEIVRVDWDVKAGGTAGTESATIKSITIGQRRGRVGHGYVLKRKISAGLFPAVKGESDPLPVNLVVNELLDSGKGLMVNFRFPEGENARDKEEVIQIDGNMKKTKVIYVRTHYEKMKLLREYWNTLRLTWRRIDWEVRSERARDAMEMERVLRRQNDY